MSRSRISNKNESLLLPLLLALLATTFILSLSCSQFGGSSVTKLSSGSELGIKLALIPKGQHGRHKMRSMNPRYITIHSTQNFGVGAGAQTHARLLQRGGLKSTHNSLGYLTWHYTVDAYSIYQSLPLNEQGQHADYEGTGNQKSIGIEMCENAGNSRSATVERTARLTAQLMKEFNIPLRNVVPHQHWLQIRYSDKKNLGNKNCPHFLLDQGQPGPKWEGFLRKVKSYL